MLKSIHIKGFRSCKDASIDDMGNLVALIGRNAAGKTSILKAIEWISRFASNVTNDGLLFGPFSGEMKVSVSVDLNGSVYDYSFAAMSKFHKGDFSFVLTESLEATVGSRRTVVCKRQGEKVVLDEKQETLSINIAVSCLAALGAILPPTSSTLQLLSPLLEYFKRVRYYALDEPSDAAEMAAGTQVVRVEAYNEWTAGLSKSRKPGNSVVMRIIKLYKDSRLSELEDIVGPNGLDLIESIRVSEYPTGRNEGEGEGGGRFFVVAFQPLAFISPLPPLGYDHLSCGTRRVLRLLTSLAFDDSSLLLVEHPEDGVHSGLVKRLMKRIRRHLGSSQLIMSTHSLTILNELEPFELRLVEMADGATSVKSLTEEEKQAAKEFILEDGGSLADFVETIGG